MCAAQEAAGCSTELKHLFGNLACFLDLLAQAGACRCCRVLCGLCAIPAVQCGWCRIWGLTTTWGCQQLLQPHICLQLPGDLQWRVMSHVHRLCRARGCLAAGWLSGPQGSAVISWDHRGDTASICSVGASFQWDVRLDGLILGAAALFEAEVNQIYTGVVTLLAPAFWLPSGL